MMPYERNHYFVGREHELETVRNDFPLAVKNHHRIVIYGLGGVGKTQFAIEYHYRYRNFYNKQFWVNATDRPNLISGLCRIGKHLNIVETRNITGERLAQLTLGHLSEQLEEWLLVVDNLDNPDVLKNLSLTGKNTGHILITSRNPDLWRLPSQALELQILDENDAVKLLVTRTEDRNICETVAEGIVNELGCLPLAIEQAAGYIRASISGVSGFCSNYRRNRKAFLSRPGRPDYPESVATTWLIAIQNLGKEAAIALELLYLLAFLNPDDVSIEFLLCCQEGREEWMNSILTRAALEPAVWGLRRYSLIRLLQANTSISVHRLVQDVVKDFMGPEKRRVWRERALELCNASFPMPRQKEIASNRLARNQVMHCLSDPELGCASITAELTSRMAWYLDCEGQYQDAYNLWKRALEIYQKLTNGAGKEIYITMDRIGNTEMKLGLISEAVATFRKASESLLAWGEQDEDVLACQRNLAVALLKSGRREEGLALLQRIYESQRRCTGDKCPRTQSTMVKLARAYQEEGRLHEARELLQRVCDQTQVRKSGNYHRALSELGWIHCSMQKVEDGVACLEDAQKLQVAALGEDNPTTLKTSSYLGYAYTLLKSNIAIGIEMLERTIEKQEEILGASHVDTMRSRNLRENVKELI